MTDKTYTVEVYRSEEMLNDNAYLADLEIDPGELDPDFYKDSLTYQAYVNYYDSDVLIIPSIADDRAICKVNGTRVKSGHPAMVYLNQPGEETDITVEVTAENGLTSRIYSITVYRPSGPVSHDASLADFEVMPGNLMPQFDSDTMEYNTKVNSDVENVDITATLNDENASLTIVGEQAGSGQARQVTIGSKGSTTTIETVVTAEDQFTQRTYLLHVYRSEVLLSDDSNLNDLEVSPGHLDPVFDPITTFYTVGVEHDQTHIDVTPYLSDTSAIVEIEENRVAHGAFQKVFLNPAGTETQIKVKVTAEDGYSQKTYTITVERADPPSDDANLSSLSVNPGNLYPNFASHITGYEVEVAWNDDTVDVTASLSDENASFTVDGSTAVSGVAREVSLNAAGSETEIELLVTAENDYTDKKYTVKVIRESSPDNADLDDMILEPGNLHPPFESGVTDYNVAVSSNVEETDVTALLSDENASFTINGDPEESGIPRTVSLEAPGSTKTININVTAANGVSNQTYTVEFYRSEEILSDNSDLSDLTVAPGSLDPVFDSGTLEYSVTVQENDDTIDITPTLDDVNAIVEIDGIRAHSGSPETVSLNPAGSDTTVEVAVTAEDGESTKTYAITVSRPSMPSDNANLAGLNLEPGNLEPAFESGGTDYNVAVSSKVEDTDVTALLSDENASFTVNGDPEESGIPRTVSLEPKGSTTTINIEVTAEDEVTDTTYTVEIYRSEEILNYNAYLIDLVVNPGELNPDFEPGVQNYSVSLNYDDPQIHLTGSPEDPAAIMEINQTRVESDEVKTVPLNYPGEETNIEILVTAQDGSTTILYTVTVTRTPGPGHNASLSNLITLPGYLKPQFDPETIGYNIKVSSDVETVDVAALLSDEEASMTIIGDSTASGQTKPVSIGIIGSTTTIDIRVTSADGVNEKIYTVDVYRTDRILSDNADLLDLYVSPGTLLPDFSPDTTEYTVNLEYDVAEINVAPILANSRAIIEINQLRMESGKTKTIPLDVPGTTTEINIKIIAENGINTRLYTVTVNRADGPGHDAFLSDLVTEPGFLTPQFNKNAFHYIVKVSSNIESIDITATLSDTNASMTIIGDDTESGQTKQINLSNKGSTSPVAIQVTSADELVEMNYTVRVYRALEILSDDPDLKDIRVEPGELSPSFDRDTTKYEVELEYDDDTIDIIPILSDINAIVEINDLRVAHNQASIVELGEPGSETKITLLTTAEDGIRSRQYLITVRKKTFSGIDDPYDEVYVVGGEEGFININKNETAKIYFTAEESGYVNYTIYNLNASIVYRDKMYTGAGENFIEWEVNNFRDNIVQSGIYIIQMEGPGFEEQRKIPVLK